MARLLHGDVAFFIPEITRVQAWFHQSNPFQRGIDGIMHGDDVIVAFQLRKIGQGRRFVLVLGGNIGGGAEQKQKKKQVHRIHT